MTRSRTAAILLLILSGLFMPGSGSLAAGKKSRNTILTVSAAASLTVTMPLIAEAWKKSGGSEVIFNFDATSRLAKQISQGAPADLFISADGDWMDFLQDKNLLLQNSRKNLVTNDLVVVSGINTPQGFSLNTVPKLALAGENVPAGKYAQAALSAAGLWKNLRGRIVRGDNVRTVLAWAAAGDVPAAVVYKTDALSAPEKVRIVHTFPASSHPVITYPAAILKSSARKEQASAFLAFCRSSAAIKIFEQAGFTASPGS